MKKLKKFSEMGIQPEISGLIGEKISMKRLVNREITVHAFKISNSKYPDNGNSKCLQMQVSIGDEMRVVFTGSIILQATIQKISPDDFPFTTTIEEDNMRLEFK